MNPLVSIIIPCFNAERWISEAIRSCLAQTYQPVEVIVVDDGSTDDSLPVARRHESSQVRILRQKQQGPGAARNHGFSICRGDYIQYLDADDILDRFKIARQLRLLFEQPGAIACGKWAKFSDSVATARFERDPYSLSMAPLDWLLFLAQAGYMMPAHGWLTPRSIIEAAGPWKPDLRLHDDGEFFCRVVLKASHVVYAPDSKVYYRAGNLNSVSHSTGRSAMESFFKVANSISDHVLAHNGCKAAKIISASQLGSFLYAANGKCPDLESAAESRFASLGEGHLPMGGAVLRGMCFGLGTLNALKLRRSLNRLFSS